ncbi:hypothetical protein ITJ38_03790 [Agreia pratensis]|uniref:hypothetical protein n=1 Tax=Agreia pratensis TaxID=150121 RepID=UPI00188A7D71|nr:hypothetical protein [Agreia pratensis]MBF4633522.1 hypothetical protein [Agreia pratensis]
MELHTLCERLMVFEGDWDLIPDGGSGLNVHPLEVRPYDFLYQAEIDLTHSTAGSDQNAYTNAKRAITCAIDEILMTFGYESLRWNTAKKVKTISEMGIPAPLIIGKINATRNMLEHSYKRASRSEAEDAVGVATLFVEASSPVVRLFPGDFMMATGWESDHYKRSIVFGYSEDPDRGFRVFEYGAIERGIVFVTIDDSSFTRIVSLALAVNRGVGTESAFENFRSSLRS